MSLRIEALQLRAFGPFTGTELELRGSPGSFHIICGPNEAGKSTAQRAVGDFLFGIPVRSRDNQLHDHGDMRVGAVLLDAENRRLELIRRKGNRSTLLGPDGPVDEGLLARMLGGMSREEFTAMFSITHESLVVGGEALLAAGGEVGESLFSASLGASSLHRVREALEAEASELYRPRAHKTAIMRAHAALEAAQAQLREATLRAGSYTELERTLADTAEQRAVVVGRLAEARREQNGRRRLRALIPLLSEHGRLTGDLAALGVVPALGDDATDRRVAAETRVAGARTQADEAREWIARLDGEIAAVSDDGPLLEREVAITGLAGRIGGYGEGREDLSRQESKLELARGLAARSLAEVRSPVALADSAQLLLDARQRGQIEEALEGRTSLRARLEATGAEADEADQRVSELRAAVDRSEAAPDTAQLELIADDARAEGPLEARLAEAEENCQDAREALNGAVVGLRPARAAGELADLLCPGAATVERFAREFDGLAEQTAALTQRRDQLEGDRRRLAEDRARLALGNDVPTQEELLFARSRRDRDWGRIRRRLEGDMSVEISPTNFERGLQVADEVADSLRQHAGFAAQAAELDLRDTRLEQEFARLSRAEDELSARRARAQIDWQGAWAETGIDPLSPREMSQWLRDRDLVVERWTALARAERTRSGWDQRLVDHRGALGTALSQIGAGSDAGASLERLLTQAGTVIEAANAQRRASAQLAHDLEAALRRATRQRATVRSVEAELERWNADWVALVQASGWPADVAPEEARRLLGTLEELSRHLHDIEALDQRVTGIRSRLEGFCTEAFQLVGELAPELASWPIGDAINELAQRLARALEQRESRRGLERDRENARIALERAQRAGREAASELEALVRLAGVDDVGALADVEERAAERSRLRSRLPELESQISQVGQAPLAELLDTAGGVDPDALEAQIAAAESDIDALDLTRAGLDERHGELRIERGRMERAGGAAAAGQLVEEQIAELRALVERYLRVYLAAWALREAIDQYRRDHKDPLLRRASELFPQLTVGGSFTGLEADFDAADEPVLIGVRANGERVRVEEMSTGTREQLYLSLRLASLERHVELHGPMPVILDDVVLHSDPRRTTAILQALAELGRSTQVIAFSHDPQTVALAQAAIDPSLLTIHELGSRDLEHALHPVVGAGDVRPLRQREAA